MVSELIVFALCAGYFYVTIIAVLGGFKLCTSAVRSLSLRVGHRSLQYFLVRVGHSTVESHIDLVDEGTVNICCRSCDGLNMARRRSCSQRHSRSIDVHSCPVGSRASVTIRRFGQSFVDTSRRSTGCCKSTALPSIDRDCSVGSRHTGVVWCVESKWTMFRVGESTGSHSKYGRLY